MKTVLEILTGEFIKAWVGKTEFHAGLFSLGAHVGLTGVFDNLHLVCWSPAHRVSLLRCMVAEAHRDLDRLLRSGPWRLVKESEMLEPVF